MEVFGGANNFLVRDGGDEYGIMVGIIYFLISATGEFVNIFALGVRYFIFRLNSFI